MSKAMILVVTTCTLLGTLITVRTTVTFDASPNHRDAQLLESYEPAGDRRLTTSGTQQFEGDQHGNH